MAVITEAPKLRELPAGTMHDGMDCVFEDDLDLYRRIISIGGQIPPEDTSLTNRETLLAEPTCPSDGFHVIVDLKGRKAGVFNGDAVLPTSSDQ